MFILKRLVFCMLSVFVLLAAEDVRPFCILTNREGAGLFSMFSDVLAAVDSYDRGIFQGIEVDFGEQGLYWAKNYGPNWWSYYCEPICLGEKKNVCQGEYSQLPNIVERYYYKSRKEAYQLIQKYFRFRTYLIHEVENFVQLHFTGYDVIGVHYRGTDAPGRLPYELYSEKIKHMIDFLNFDNYKIFIATDEQLFIEYMMEQFPGKICFQTQILRSLNRQPLHFSSDYNRYLQGKETIIDCLLLSKCSCLVLSYSNLSLWAALLNPYIPAVDLNHSLELVSQTNT